MLNRLLSFLKEATSVVVIGMGSELRTDDAVGLHVVRLLKPHTSRHLQVFEGHMTPEAFIAPACALHPTHILIVDAAELHKKAGTWQVLSPNTIKQGLFTTHAIPATAVAAELQRRCSAQVAFIGIQPKSREISLSLSKECQAAVEEIVNIIHKTVS